jgi:hypothetical protein
MMQDVEILSIFVGGWAFIALIASAMTWYRKRHGSPKPKACPRPMVDNGALVDFTKASLPPIWARAWGPLMVS